MTLHLDDLGLRATPTGSAAAIEIHWTDIVGVDIETNDLGPFAEDVYWVLHATDRPRALVFGQGDANTGPLLDSLQQLEGFDHEAFIASMSSTEEAVFEIWRRRT